MRKIGWFSFSALVLGTVFGGGLLLAANLYVQSQQVQQRIRQALASSLRMPVSVKKTTVTPWEGLRIDGITSQSENSDAHPHGRPANSISVASFRVRFALTPLLLHRQLVIRDVLLDRPKVAWAQDDAGRWQFPADREPNRRKKSPSKSPAVLPGPSPGTGEAEPPASPSPAPLVSSEAAPVETPPPATRPVAASRPSTRQLENFVLTVGRFRLRHGDMEFLNKKRGLIGRFNEVNLDGRVSDPAHADGTVSFEAASLPRFGLKLTQFRSHLLYDHLDGLTLDNGHATLAGGTIQADYRLRTGEPDSPFSAQCRIDDVSIGQLIKEAGSKLALVEGKLQGDLSVEGRSDDPESRVAKGRFELTNAQVHGFPLFQVLGDALHIADLSHLQFKTAQLDYTVQGVWLNVDPLLLVSNDLQIRAQGRYQTDEDRLDLQARLILDASVSKQLPRFVNEKLTPCPDDSSGSQYIDFQVGGPLGKPTTNLYKQMIPNDVGSLLQNLLAPKPKKNKSVRPKESPSPGAADDR